jgi:23S rRNA pseudouridine2605 synthase
VNRESSGLIASIHYSARVAQERIQKILARAGLASRRGAEELISSGRVKVNGRAVTELGAKANPRSDRIEVDGKLIEAERPVYVLFHKPRGVVCTMSDPEGRPTVAQYVKDVEERIVPVGRLDFHTSGVLLMTNDGDFAAALVHPSKHVQKVYVAKLRGVLDDMAIEELAKPISIDGKVTQPAHVKRLRVEGDKTWVEFTLREGRNRQIHRITEATGTAVFRLARISFAGLTAEGLRPGQWRYLSKDELRTFKADFGYPKKVANPPMPPTADKLARTRQRVENIRTGDKHKAAEKAVELASDNARSARRASKGAKRGTETARRTSKGRTSGEGPRTAKPSGGTRRGAGRGGETRTTDAIQSDSVRDRGTRGKRPLRAKRPRKG